MPNTEKNVCSQSWDGDSGETIDLKNPHDDVVTVSPVDGYTWPFESPTDSFDVPEEGNGPGITTVTRHL